MTKTELSGVCRVVLYAIAMVDYDQDGADPCDKLTTTREGIQTIALYSSSIGR
jgi:Rab proteins geranylgeranyltransferase component A